VLREDTPGAARLVAYVVLEPGDAAGAAAAAASVVLRQWLQPQLPDYMLPAAYVVIAQLPLTAHGKLDRKALPAPDSERMDVEHSYVAPRSPAEKTLAEIWSRILGVEKIGVFDNFFATGGDSILSIQVIAHANQAGIRLSPRQFFQHPTIAELVAAAARNEAQPVLTELAAGPIPLTPIQRWFFDQHPEQPQHWNTSILLEVPPGLNQQLLGRATHYLQSYHDALRLRFTDTEAGWQQTTALDPVPSPFRQIDLSKTSKRKLAQAITAEAAALQQSLDLAAGPLFRVAYFDLGPRHNGRVMIVFHHLVVDGVSLRIFVGDLLTVYRQLDQDEAPALPPKTTPFQAWAAQMEAYAQTASVRQELDYWLALSRQAAPALPVDFPGGANSYGDAMRLVAGLNVQETQALLREVPAAYGSQINDVLLTALVQTFARWTGEQRLLIELDSHGREDVLEGVDVSRTVGWFTSIYPVLLDLTATDDPVAALREVQAQLRRLPQRGIGYGLLRYACRDETIRSALSQMPQPEVNFNYLGQFDQPVGAPPATSPETEAGGNGTAAVVPFRVAGESVGPEQYPHGRRSALLYIVGVVAGGKLNIQWSYSAKLYKKSTVERLARNYLKELRQLIAYSRSVEGGLIK
ncbi:MAG: condensation domain-containing protein, partial [Chloroflexales bacterium]|nr:condensation domain-containing protein [Chloroflexales bacterium]